MSKNDIVVQSVSKSFNKNKVLNDFSCTFKNGGTTCIMGRSGCGKTTLLNILMGLLKADSGVITGMPKNISVVFQEDRLCEGFDIIKNINLVCRERVPDDVMAAHLEANGLLGAENKPVRELSGGMKRRAAIIRAVLSGWDVLIMDEPFKGLDEATRETTAAYIKKQTAGKTVIMVTHDQEEVALMEGRLIEMKGADYADKE